MALSYNGAQKLLKWLSTDIYNQPIDLCLHDMCSKSQRNFKCISVFPQVKGAGGNNEDSDVGPGGTDSRKVGFSYNIVLRTRLNADLDEVTCQ